MDKEEPTVDIDQQETEARAPEGGFEPVPPENDEPTEAAAGAELDDDSDAPISLDDLAPESSESVAVGPGTDVVRAESVSVSQGGAQSIEAANVSITQGGATNVRAEAMSVEQGGVVMARTGQLTIKSNGSAFAVQADSATLEKGANVFVLISRSASGEARPVLDWRAALAVGGGFALVLSILRRLR